MELIKMRGINGQLFFLGNTDFKLEGLSVSSEELVICVGDDFTLFVTSVEYSTEV